jgi:nitrogen-specific signal transduction histidine kinase
VTPGPPPPDAAVLNRVQQDNQRQLVGKLLHDLRNPVHSIRISMELFGRLARRNGDVDKLMERAAQYIDPAEAAVASLVANSDRLSRYLAAAAAPETQTLPVDELLSEVVSLLRASRRRLQVTPTLPEPPMPAVRADRMRLCHVLLHSCLSNAASAVTIAVRPANGLVTFDLGFQAAPTGAAARATPLSAEDLRLIVETAGGALVAASDAALTMEFRPANDPPPG